MSTSPEADFDLEKLFLPAWAKESPQHNRYAKFEGEPQRRDDRRGDHRGPPRRPDFGGGRGAAPARGPAGPGRGDRPRSAQPGGRPFRGPDRGDDRRLDARRPAPPPVVPLPDVLVAFTPEEHGVDSLTKQIRISGRAYPLFQIAQLILQKPERHTVTFSVKKKSDGGVMQPLFLCALDETLWLSEEDAIGYVLNKHFSTFYQPERTQIDPPKGVYTFVAQCGMSGVILGPPNYHDYQNQLRKLHTEKFSRMPFEAFKARVRIVKDEEVVKKWVEEQSWKTEFTCLNLPEPLKLATMEDVEKHFRATHLADIVKPADTFRMAGAAARNIRDRELMRLLRLRWEEQKRFPLQIATVLSQQFASRGLSFFKVNKTVTHVAVARPQFLDLESTPVSDGVKRIVDYINNTPKCTHKRLLQALAPAPAAVPAPAKPPTESTGEVSETAGAPASIQADPTPEMAAVMTDLHWLVHQGHVIEFGNGVLETAKKPLPRPPKPVKTQVPSSSSKVETAPVEESVTGISPELSASEASAPSSSSPNEGETTADTAVASEPDAAEGSGGNTEPRSES